MAGVAFSAPGTQTLPTGSTINGPPQQLLTLGIGNRFRLWIAARGLFFELARNAPAHVHREQ